MTTSDKSFVYSDILTTLVSNVRVDTVRILRKLFVQAVSECEANGQPKLVLEAAQILLSNIPRWSRSNVRRLTTKLVIRTPEIRDIVEATVKARVAIYDQCYGVRTFKLPHISIDDFTHSLLINSARRFYTKPYLLGKDTNPTIARKNYNECLKVVAEAVRDVIHQFAPMQQLIRRLPTHPTINLTGVRTSVRDSQKRNRLSRKITRIPNRKSSQSRQASDQEQVDTQNTEFVSHVQDEVRYDIQNGGSHDKSDRNHLSAPQCREFEESPTMSVVQKDEPTPEQVIEHAPEEVVVQKDEPTPEKGNEMASEEVVVQKDEPMQQQVIEHVVQKDESTPEKVIEPEPEDVVVQKDEPTPEKVIEPASEEVVVQKDEPTPEQMIEPAPEDVVVQKYEPTPEKVIESAPEEVVVQKDEPTPEKGNEMASEEVVVQKDEPTPEKGNEMASEEVVVQKDEPTPEQKQKETENTANPFLNL